MSDSPAPTFTCNNCHGEFEKAWTDEEALTEAEVNGFDLDDVCLVCDDCYAPIMAYNNHTPGAPR